MKVGIVAQRDNPRAATLARDVVGTLAADDVTVVVDETTAERVGPRAGQQVTGVEIEEMATCELVVSIGGDGTFLYAARAAGATPVMGVNLGEVGFLNAVSPDDAERVVSDAVTTLREGGDAETRAMARVRADGDGWSIPPAINEIAVLGPQRGHGQGFEIEVTVDGDPYTSGHADGVLIATPTGSTAYNLSEGGPLVHPDVGGLVVTDMAGESTLPPLVVDEDSSIDVRVSEATHAFVVSDGRTSERVAAPTTVTVGRADTPLNIAGPPLDFFAGLGKLD